MHFNFAHAIDLGQSTSDEHGAAGVAVVEGGHQVSSGGGRASPGNCTNSPRGHAEAGGRHGGKWGGSRGSVAVSPRHVIARRNGLATILAEHCHSNLSPFGAAGWFSA